MSEHTLVLSFGQQASTSSGLLFLVELDPEVHADADGNIASSFAPGDSITMLVHHDPAIRIISISDTAGGTLESLGIVSREQTVEMHWDRAGAEQELPKIPAGNLSFNWFGRVGQLIQDGRTLTAVSGHCTGEITFTYQASRYRYTPSSQVVVLAERTFPVDLDFAYEEIA